MLKAVRKFYPQADFIPFIAYGGTDLRFVRDNNAEGYGFSLLTPDTTADEASGLAHGTDERVRIKDLELTLNVYYQLAKEFLT